MKWVPLIRSYQLLDNQKAVYICDLHFNAIDLIKNGKTLRLRKNATPILGYISHQLYNRLKFEFQVFPLSHRNIETNLVQADEVLSNDLGSGYDSITLSQSNCPNNGTSDAVSISKDAYERLIKDSIDLLKANEKIIKLNQTLCKKDEELNKIKNSNQNSNMDHL